MSSTSELYESCKNLLHKKIQLSPPFSHIETWISENLNVSPLNITYDTNFCRLNFIFKDEKDLEKFIIETERKFKTVPLSSIQYQNILKDYPGFATEQLYLEYIHFSHLAIRYISSISEMSQFQKELNIDSLWKIHKRGVTSCIFFFQDESEAKKYNENTNKDHLIDKYFSFLKRNDEFDLLDKKDIFVIIDTKENLEIMYEGSMQFYLRDH